MAFPPEIPTRAISVGGAAVLESSTLLKVQVTVTASKSLVWDATGFRYERMSVTDTSDLGSELVIPLPRTDVQGWKDAKTGEIIDVSAPGSYTHRYTAVVRFLDADNRPVAVSPVTLGPFVVPAGDGPIDLDKTVPASTVAGDTVNVPDWWGQLVAEAQAAADQAAQSMIDSDQFIADQIATPGTATATQLSATIDEAVAVKPYTVLVNGDSIDYGAGVTDRLTKGFAPRLKAHLETFLGVTVDVIVTATGGSYTGSSAGRLAAALAQHKPNLVWIKGTPNDARIDGGQAPLKDTATNIRKMIGLCRAYGATPILSTSTPIDHSKFTPAGVYDASSETTRQAQDDIIRAIAVEQNVRLIDTDKALGTSQRFPQVYTTDGIHPGDAGADILAQIAARGIAAQPTIQFIWPVVASDDFNRPDSTTTLGGGSVPWATLQGIGGISAGRAYSVDGNYWGSVETGSTRHEITARITPTATAGVLARVIDVNNHLVIVWQTGASMTIRIYKFVAGVLTQLAVTSAPMPASGATFDLGARVDGNTVTAFVDGATVLTHTLSAADAAVFATATKVGLRLAGNSVSTVTVDSVQIAVPTS